MKYIGIIVAEDKELEAVLDVMSDISDEKIYDIDVHFGKIGDVSCLVVKAGIGKVNAGRTTQIIIDKFEISSVINIGAGGATDSVLKIGDVVISKGLVQYDFDVTAFGREKGFISGVGKIFEADKTLISLCEKAFDLCGIRYDEGIIATGDKFVDSKEEKKEIGDEFDAKCVEMEGAAIAHVCTLCNVPFVVIRSISDELDGEAKVDFEEFLETVSKKCADVLKIVLPNLM